MASQRIVRERCFSIRSGVRAKTARSMSGSTPSLLGLPWCLLCLPCHQPELIPTSRLATIKLTQSFHLPDLKICRWAAS